MVGRRRVLGLERGFVPGAVACLALGTGACILVPSDHRVPIESAGAAGSATRFTPSAGGAPGATGSSAPFPTTGGGFGAGATGATGVGARGAIGATGCTPPGVVSKAVFAEQTIDTRALARRELFSWTTDEQAAALRRDRVLFSESERPGARLGDAFEVFDTFARDPINPERAELAGLLGGALFEKARIAWTEPWAARMGWPGEDYGGNLLRIVLKPQAWVVVVKNGQLSVFDLQNVPVSLSDALTSPERLGAIFYQRDAFAGGPACDVMFPSGSGGYREFIVGNPAMVEEWSLGTQQIRDRLRANIEQLSTFFERIRACPTTSNAQQWSLAVVCGWDRLDPDHDELSAYQLSLATPSENYLAAPDRIAAMIDILHGDLFEPDPLVVTAGSP